MTVRADHRSGIAPNPEGEAYSFATLRIPLSAPAIVRGVLTVLLTRHGHTPLSEPEQYLGQRMDPPIDARGRRDARALATRLEPVQIERVLTSPLKRAQQTAAIVAAPHKVTVEIDTRLIELDYGSWEGHTIDQINRAFPGEHARYDANPADHPVGGGESGKDVARRLRPVIAELLKWAEGDGKEHTCLLVGHSSTNRLLLALLTGVKLADYRRRFDQDWDNLTVLYWPDRASGPILRLANDLSHARGISGVTWG